MAILDVALALLVLLVLWAIQREPIVVDDDYDPYAEPFGDL